MDEKEKLSLRVLLNLLSEMEQEAQQFRESVRTTLTAVQRRLMAIEDWKEEASSELRMLEEKVRKLTQLLYVKDKQLKELEIAMLRKVDKPWFGGGIG